MTTHGGRMAAQVVKGWLMGRGRDDNDRVPSKKVGNACERRHGHIEGGQVDPLDNVTVVRDLITPK